MVTPSTKRAANTMGTLWTLTVIILSLSLETCQGKGDCLNQKMDIAILADTSRSMNEEQLKTLTQLVGKIIDETGVSPEGSHYGFITFNREVNVRTTFSNPNYHNKENLKNLISEIQESRDVDWGTRSDIALSEATKLFTVDGGDRPDAKNFVFVFTDGKFKITPKDKNPNIPFEDSTKALKEKEVKITIIAILGGNCRESKTALQACEDEMNKMAGEQGEVLMFKDFDDLIKRYQEVLDSLCTVDGNYTDWTISECSVTCGGGVKTFTRTCTNPPPSNGRKNCNDLGPAEKTERCNEHKCPPPCTAGLDIGILLDKSDSVKNENLVKVLNFLKNLIEKFNPAPDADHFGFITFNNEANVVFNFSNSDYHNKKDLLNKIESEPIKLAYGTRTDLALKLANNSLFTDAGGDRPDKPNVMLVFTDGKPTCPKKKEKRKFNFKHLVDNIAKDLKETDALLKRIAMLDRQTRSELALIKARDDNEKRKNKHEHCEFKAFADNIADDFKKKHVYVVAVGIGKNVDNNILQSIAGVEGKVVHVKNFDALEGLIKNVKTSACSD